MIRTCKRSTLIAAVSVMAGCALLVGCERKHDDIETEYGERSELRLASSVNGYGVLADMFAKSGHAVSNQSDLTPELKASADAIVYAPDSFAPPDDATVAWFEEWLNAKADRTLIYIGRDFDAAPIYWRKIRSQVPAKDQPEVDRRMRAAQAEFLIKRMRFRTKPPTASGSISSAESLTVATCASLMATGAPGSMSKTLRSS